MSARNSINFFIDKTCTRRGDFLNVYIFYVYPSMCNPLFVLVEEKLRAFPLSRFLSIKTYLMNEEGKLFL